MDVAAAAAGAGVQSESTRPADHDGVNRFQHALSAWRGVDLTNLVSTLDNTASDIVTYQRDSTVQRKDLAQKTKDFRKLDDATKLNEFKSLLKAYQTFIDLLTNHSKAINSAFLHVYTPLSEAPDPYPLLEASVDSMLIAEDTVPKLASENDHLQRTVANLTSQLDETESRLGLERMTRQSLETGLENRVREVETSWAAVLDEKQDNWGAKERALEEKLENQERLLAEIKASQEVDQRLSRTEADHWDGRGHVANAETEMLHSELNRATARLAEIEGRNEQLRVQLAQARSYVPQQVPASLEDNSEFMRIRSENSSLIRKLESGRVEKEGLKRDLDSRMRGLERDTVLLREERDVLKAKLHRWSDYDNVKQELEVLKSIEFSTGDDDDENGVDNKIATEPTSSHEHGDGLEKLLVARNKKLSEELTILRVSHHDLQKRLDELTTAAAKTEAELARALKLNERLEEDLATLQTDAANTLTPSGASVAGSYMGRYGPSAVAGRRARVSPASSIIGGVDTRAMGGEPMGGGSGILPMITAQRDRFKVRMAQLEQELSDSQRNVSQLRQEVAALQRDNLSLYEKTRYVSTYNRGGGSHAATAGAHAVGASASGALAASTAYPLSAHPTVVPMGGSGGQHQQQQHHYQAGMNGLDSYRKAYESNLSPFAAFRGRESARAYRRMSLPERVVYSVTRVVLASRTSRNLFAAYCVALHLLVFFSLYSLGIADVDRSASHLAGVGHALSKAGPPAIAAAAVAAAAGAGGAGLEAQSG